MSAAPESPPPESARARASRANGRKSTGPTSAAGKRRARGNARRHGLTVPAIAHAGFAREVEDLARRIEVSVAGAELDAGRHELACRIAEKAYLAGQHVFVWLDDSADLRFLLPQPEGWRAGPQLVGHPAVRLGWTPATGMI